MSRPAASDGPEKLVAEIVKKSGGVMRDTGMTPAAPDPETPETDILCDRQDADFVAVWECIAKDKLEIRAHARSIERRLAEAKRGIEIRDKSLTIAMQEQQLASNRADEAELQHSLAQTEIKGHMRLEDDLKADLFKAQDRIAELEKDAARYKWIEENLIDWYPKGYNGCKYDRFDALWPNEERDLGKAVDAAIAAALKSRT
jgi:uncharacterized protein YhaN